MKKNCRFFYFIESFWFQFKKKFFLFEKSFSLMLFCLFLGFIFGSIFGTFLNTLRYFFIWDGFIIFVLLTFFEFLNYIVYHAKKRLFLNIFYFDSFEKTKNFWKFINLCKIGMLLGFFIDAFKVGS